jgi:hypothetical protein
VRIGAHLVTQFISIARQCSRRRLSLSLIISHLCIACLIVGYVALPRCMLLWKHIAISHAERREDGLEHRRKTDLNGVSLQISRLHRDMSEVSPVAVDGTRVHTLIRELAQTAGMFLHGFIAQEAEGDYLVTLEGGFDNVVTMASSLRSQLATFRVQRFSVRLPSSSTHRLTVEFVIKKAPSVPQISQFCNTILK